MPAQTPIGCRIVWLSIPAAISLSESPIIRLGMPHATSPSGWNAALPCAHRRPSCRSQLFIAAAKSFACVSSSVLYR